MEPFWLPSRHLKSIMLEYGIAKHMTFFGRKANAVMNSLLQSHSEPVVDPAISGAQSSSEDWGRQFLKQLAPRMLTLPASVARAAQLLAPLLVVAVLLLIMGYVRYATMYNAAGRGLAGFADISSIGATHLGIPQAADNNTVGYDGQFYFAMAYRPSLIVTCIHGHAPCPLGDPEFRWQRVLYAMTAWLLAFGQPQLVGFSLLLVNFLAILVTTLLVGSLSIQAGASRWLGAAAGLFCGEALGFLRDLADPYSVMWLVVAVYLLRKKHYRWMAAACAAALLTRESLIFVVPFFALPLLGQHRWRALAEWAVIGLGPFVAWQIFLRALYGKFPLLVGDTQAAQLVPLPFAGFWHTRNTSPEFTMTLIFVVVPMLLACAIALLTLWQNGPRSILSDPLPLLIPVYCLLLSLTYWFNWANFWAPTRLVAPTIVLSVIMVAGLKRPSWRSAYGALLAVSSLSPLLVLLGR